MADRPTLDEISERWAKVWPRIVAKAWTDDAFLIKLIKTPEVVAREYDLPMVKGLKYRVSMGDMPPTLLLSVPPRPSDLEEKDLLQMSEDDGGRNCADSSTF